METPENNVEKTALIATGDAPRVLAGLIAGRLVNFVMADESVRPFLVVIPNDATGPVNGVLFIDGPHDRQLCPRNIAPEQSGAFPEVAVRLVDVAYSELHEPGSWHWPAKQPVIAAGIDANAINTAVAMMMEPVVARMRQQIIDDVSVRIEGLQKLLQDSLDSHSELLNDTLAKIKHPVLQMPSSGGPGCDHCVVTIDGEGRAFHEQACPAGKGAEISYGALNGGAVAQASESAADAGSGAASGNACSHPALNHDRVCLSCGEAVPFQASKAEGAVTSITPPTGEAKSESESGQAKAASGQDGQSAS